MLASAAPSGISQFGDLAVALALTAAIGLERQVREKSGGLRTHAVIGLGAALFVLISKYGFFDVLWPQHVVLDPSRVAAQIASGIGFVGAGMIFVRRGDVKGLTSAAAVWLTAAVGAAAGAGLFAAALWATGGYFVIALGLTYGERFLVRARRDQLQLDISYPPGEGVLQRALELCELHGFDQVSVVAGIPATNGSDIEARIVLLGRGPTSTLMALVGDIPGVRTATIHQAA